MNKTDNSFKISIKYTSYALFLLGIVFLGATILWIWITPYNILEFNVVLSKVIKYAGSYSALLVGVIVTIFFQVYSKNKELELEDRIKIAEVGYYTLAFKRPEDDYFEEYTGDKLVVEINEEGDFYFDAEIENEYYFHFMTKFLISKSNVTNLKNIMAFSEKYFEKNRRNILKNYYEYCERITYCSPLYCSTKPTNELTNNKLIDRNRYFWMILKCNNDDCIKNFWLSAVTEEGILLFIKIKARIRVHRDNDLVKAKIILLQQTTYYESRNRLCVLYK